MLLKDIQSQIGHNIDQTFQVVHEALNHKYNWNRQAQREKIRAQKMEQYLRLFKGLASAHSEQFIAGYNGNIDIQSMKLITEAVQKQITSLSTNKTKASRMFYNVHSKYVGESQISGVDDVFEAELRELLNFALQEAVQDSASISQENYAQVLGQQLGNIPKYAIEKLFNKSSQLVEKTSKEGKFNKKPQYKSAKVDVQGYGGQIFLEAQIKPEWLEFIQLFTNARFTVKNYKSNSKNNVTISLGSTDARKAIVASLIDLQVNQDDAVHVYWHSLNTKKTNFQSHIFHLRFAYELTGAGLVDEDGDKIDGADFFIYNDPTSDNVFVRSTKDMIANMMKYTPSFQGNPYKSKIVVVKTAFY